MNLIVTGALGHIGSMLIRILPKKFDNVKLTLIDDLSTQRYTSLFNLKGVDFSFIEGRVQDQNLEQLLEGADCLIHLAALTDASGTAEQPQKVFDNNFSATKFLADMCKKKAVPIIFPSSTSVYGSQKDKVDEECIELLPQSPYAECKIKEEQYIRELFEKGLTGVICRLGTIYGTSPGMRFHTAVNKFCWQAAIGMPLSVWQTAFNQKRPYLFLEDCCNAIAWIIEHRLYAGEIFNIVSNNFTVQDVIEEIKKHKPNLVVNMVSHKIMNQLSYEVSANKFVNTGFKFKSSFSRALKDTMSMLMGI